MTSPVAKRTAVLLSMLLIIIAVALGWWALTTIKGEVTKDMSRSLRTVPHTSIEAMDIWLEDQRDELRTLAADPRLATLAAGQLERHNRGNQLLPSSELGGLRRLFSDFQKTSRHIGIFVIAPDSTSIASMRDANIGWVNLIEEQRPDLLARAFARETVLVPPIDGP